MAEKITCIRRTPTQVVLYVVSTIMVIMAVAISVGGALLIATGNNPTDLLRLTGEQTKNVTVNGILIIVASVVTLATGVLGIWAANDQRKVGPYRLLCYVVALLTLAVIIYGWSNGAFLLFNPLVLVVTVVYVLVCSSLADRVQDELDLGIKGTTIYRDGHQRALHFLSSIIIAEGAFYLVAAVASYFLVKSGTIDAAAYFSEYKISREQLDYPLVAALIFAFSSASNLIMGLLGLRGSNHPSKIAPFLVFSLISTVFMVASSVLQPIAYGIFSFDTFTSWISTLFSMACTVLAFKVRAGAGRILD